MKEIERLSTIANTQPHAAYAAFTHGVASRWTYLSRTIPDTAELFKPLEDAIRLQFIPFLTGQSPISDAMRELMALPVRLGGLGIANPSQSSTTQYNTSKLITSPLTSLIIEQSPSYSPETKMKQRRAKANARSSRRQRDTRTATELSNRLPQKLQRAMKTSAEKGASTWLATLPIAEHGFALHKQAFRDALCLRYGWHPSHLPAKCVCGMQFSIEHAMSCPRGGFPSIRHNEVRDITADLFSEVCHNVGIEPGLQPVTEEPLRHRTANREDGARLDVVVESFWGRDRQRAFFDVRVFNPFAPTYLNTSLPQCYHRHKQEKRRAYEERVREIERGSFSPLVFSIYNRWHGVNSHGCIQETSRSNGETEERLQQNHQLAQMPPEFLSAQISHHVLARVQVKHSPSSPPFRPTSPSTKVESINCPSPLSISLIVNFCISFWYIASLPIA